MPVILLAKTALAGALLAAAAALPAAAHAEAPCPHYGKPHKTGRIADARIQETSGLVASAQNPGLLWAHNDSGDQPRLFAIGEDGELAAVYTINGAGAVDWEDIALGPGPAESRDYLYIGDIGDNPGRRPYVTVYRLEEPDLSTEAAGEALERSIDKITAFDLQYPDGPHDAEVLLSDPLSGDLLIITKDFAEGISGIYRFAYPHEAASQHDGRILLEEVGRIRFQGTRASDIAVTAGDVSPAGDRVILRTYTQTLVWTRNLQTRLEHELMTVPCPVRSVGIGFPFDQFESIAYSNDGSSYYTVSEGEHPRIYRLELDAAPE